MLKNNQNNNELYHYGVLGMKWGIRKSYNNKDGLIKAGTMIRRISNQALDPTYDNKKYVSINNKDHKKWNDYLGEGYLKRGYATFDIGYTAVNDIRIASKKTTGKIYSEMVLNNKLKNKTISDTLEATKKLNQKISKNDSENASRNIAMQTETGKRIVNELIKKKIWWST